MGWGSTSPFGGVAVAVTLRWNGSSWASVPLPQPSQVMLFGVKTVARGDVWAVGHRPGMVARTRGRVSAGRARGGAAGLPSDAGALAAMARPRLLGRDSRHPRTDCRRPARRRLARVRRIRADDRRRPRPWLAETASELTAGASLGLRVEAVAPGSTANDCDDDEDEDAADTSPAPSLGIVPQMRSTADPSLIVDAADLWDQPEHVLARFGTQAETDLLLALVGALRCGPS